MPIIEELRGEEKISGFENVTVLDFWSWAYSDILSNRNRSIFAEFLVATALGEINNPRIEWDAVDLRYHGKKVEVKSAAYVQSWHQNKLSTIRFDIGKKLGWCAETNSSAIVAERNADCYVFCLFTEQIREQANILDIKKWTFFIAQTQQLEERFSNQKSVSLNYLKAICLETDFQELKQTIEKVLN
jgi:hypothetical protein